jgi:hypothetical protein
MSNLKYTKAKLLWLEAILNQRLSDELRLQVSSSSILIMLGQSDKKIEICSNLEGFEFCSTEVPCITWDYDRGAWSSLIENTLPAPGYSNLNFPLINKTNMGYKIKYDILGLTYWMFSRQEEVGSVTLDQHGRFPATSSHAFKYAYLDRPIVDEWLDILAQVMQQLWPTLEIKKHQFQIKVSHDVDIPSRYMFQNGYGRFRRIMGDILKRGEFLTTFTALGLYVKPLSKLPEGDNLNTFDWIMKQSENNNLKSAFYFICGKSHPKTDADYSIEHVAIRSLMKEIYSRGHEIGLHPSYNACNKVGLITKEAETLKKVCKQEGIIQKKWGGRMHFLRWRQPATMYDLEGIGLDYDSTLGYADHAGFRCGTCFEYPAFDPIKDRELNLRIRPLIAMDVTVSAYMGLGFGNEAYDEFTKLKNACRSVNGAFTLLWHNNQLVTKQAKELYSSLLEKL